MTTYELRRQEHLARWAELVPDHLERSGWSRDRIETERDLALRRLVSHAQESSPWHAERLAGVAVEALHGDDLTGLPTMTKADLMADFDDIVTDRRITRADAEAHLAALSDDAYFLDEYHVVASGGSSGDRGLFVYGWDAWVDVHMGLGRTLIGAILADGRAGNEPATTGLVAAANATHMTTAVARTFASPALGLQPFPVTLPVEAIVDGLNRLRPHVLLAYASMLGVLAEEASAGRLDIAPQRIVATSEPLLPEIRVAAEAAFGAPIANCWGTSEGGVMAVGCWRSGGMHVLEDLVILEPVDADGHPVQPGTRSAKVLVTNLFNPVLPLIRYELTDEITFLEAPCDCGSRHRRVDDVQGRHDDVFRYGPTTIHPHVVRSVLARHPEIVEYQVRQTGEGAEVLLRAGAATDDGRLAAELTAALRGAGLARATVAIRRVAALERHPATGKLKRFVPRSDRLASAGTH